MLEKQSCGFKAEDRKNMKSDGPLLRIAALCTSEWADQSLFFSGEKNHCLAKTGIVNFA